MEVSTVGPSCCFCHSHTDVLNPRLFAFSETGSLTWPAPSKKCRNVQRTCNEFASNVGLKTPKSCQQNGLDGGPGESRTPDQRFRNWAIIPQRVCFQCLQFGRFRAVLGLVGSGTCNGSCNIKIEGRSLSSSSSRGPAAFCDGWCESLLATPIRSSMSGERVYRACDSCSLRFSHQLWEVTSPKPMSRSRLPSSS